jgi:hypothetical protein
VGRTSTVLGEDLDDGGGARGGGAGVQVVWISTAGMRVAWTSMVEAAQRRGARGGGTDGEEPAWRRSVRRRGARRGGAGDGECVAGK